MNTTNIRGNLCVFGAKLRRLGVKWMFITITTLIALFSPFLTFAQIDYYSCVSFVREISFWGNFPQVEKALDIPVIHKKPVLGAIALYSYQPFGHSSVVIAIATSTYDVIESNFKPGIVTRRTLPLKGDPFLRGFYYY